jgi:diadenosine tetraphosphate (Ap4A) HIT family hydrolase
METNVMTVFEHPKFRVTPCDDAGIPGYLILHPAEQREWLFDAGAEQLQAIGPALAFAAKAVREVTGAERVYYALFAELNRNAHFHVFPRTPELEEQWRAENPDAPYCDGAQVLPWARAKFTDHSAFPERQPTLEKIAAWMKEHADELSI